MAKQIASFSFRNGRFGVNVASLSRLAPSKYVGGGYSVNMGNGGDPFFVRCPVEAKAMYRRALEGREAA